MRRYALIVSTAAALAYGWGPRSAENRAAASAARQDARIIRFSGYDWEVRQKGRGGPGPNLWDPADVSVDAKGRLHLRIGDDKSCAEVQTTKRLGFGRYEFQVTGRVDRLDPNVVLGLFNYTEPDVGPDGTNEIDVELARWGNPRWDNLNYTVYPSVGKADQAHDHYTKTIALTGLTTMHRFDWDASGVRYRSFAGRTEDDPHTIAQWDYTPDDRLLVPQSPIPVHINLWLFRGHPPTDRQPVEIVIDRFTFTPAR